MRPQGMGLLVQPLFPAREERRHGSDDQQDHEHRKLRTMARAGTCRDNTKLVMAAPVKLPMLHMPWSREMVRSPSCSSMAIPWAFIATSMLAPRDSKAQQCHCHQPAQLAPARPH